MTTSNKTDKLRFEEWYNANHREAIRPADYRDGGDYRFGIQGKWDVWQAAITHERAHSEVVVEAMHYPKCWDTVAYPTLFDALNELAGCVGCSECKAREARKG